MAIVRSEEQIESCRVKAQRLSFAAEDNGVHDPVADAIYGFIQWLNGDDDNDPAETYLEDFG